MCYTYGERLVGMNDKDMVRVYFDTLSLYDRASIYEDLMNLELLYRPKKIKHNTQTLYIFAPSIVASDLGLKPGSVVRVLDVYQGDTYETTSARVMIEEMYRKHKRDAGCFKYISLDERHLVGCLCECEQPTETMNEELRDTVFHVLLSDLGK